MAFLSFLAGTLGLLGAAGAYYRYLSPMLGFYLCLGALVVISLNLPVNLARFVRQGRRWISPVGLVFGLLSMIALGILLKFSIENPVTDVTNFAQNPPQFRGPASSIPVPAGMEAFVDPSFHDPREYDPTAFEKQSRAYPNIYILDFYAGPELAFSLANSVVAKHPNWRKVREDSSSGTIEVQEELPFFHSIEDFVIQVVPGEGKSSILLRSRSRFGFSDFGSNAKRIRLFLEEGMKAAASLTPPMKAEYRK